MNEVNAPSPTADTHRRNLKRLFALRWIALAATAALLACATFVIGMPLPLPALGIVLACAAAVNVWTGLRIRSSAPIGDSTLFRQLLADTATLAALLYFSGGWSNPFVSMFLLPLVIAATLLPPRRAWGIAAATLVAYTLLGLYHRPMPHVHASAGADFDLHVFGMWLSFVLSAGVVSSVVVHMARSLRDRDRDLADARERALRDQQVLALGTLAAGAAHELGTPLATMALLVGELEHACPGNAQVAADVATLRAQLDQCKGIITEMSAAAGQRRAEASTGLALDAYLGNAVDAWRSLRPGIDLSVACDGPRPAPRITSDRTLGQTLVSLLNNAADASPDGVELECRWTTEALTVDIRDRGRGVVPGIAKVAGRQRVSTKVDGQGVGLMIAASVIERLGGRVALSNREHGAGARTRIEIPLRALLAAG